MSYERGMDPTADPERRSRKLFGEQLELPLTYSESARPTEGIDEEQEAQELRAAAARVKERS